MVEPKFIYSCDHNLIDYSEKYVTIKILKNPTVNNEVADDIFVVSGVLKSVSKIYSPEAKNNLNSFCCKQSLAGCIYEKGIDFDIEVNTFGNIARIKWKHKDNIPKDNSYFYVDIIYDATADVKVECLYQSFDHNSSKDTFQSHFNNLEMVFIKSDSNTYIEGRDYKVLKTQGNNGNYSFDIVWLINAPYAKMTAVCYSAYETYENNMSTRAFVNYKNSSNSFTNNRYVGGVCPRCNNTGWYVGLFEKNCHRASNSNRMLQEFIKLIYTTSSDEGKYLINLSGSVIIDSESQIKSLLSNIVANSLTRYEKMMIEAKSNNNNISLSEEIYQAGVSNIALYEDNTGVEAEITIVTKNGQTISLTVNS